MHTGRFWFSTIALTITGSVLFALAIAAVFGTAALAFGQQDAGQMDAPRIQSVTGVLTDAHCGARHPSNSHLTARDCTRICIKQGSGWAVVDRDHVYLLQGDSPYLDKLAGERVKVSGVLDGNTMKMQSIDPETL